MDKTLLITVFDATIAKNILRTKVLSLLRETPGLRIVILPPPGKIESYTEEFSVPGKVFIEQTPAWKHDRFEFGLEALYKHSIPTRFMRIRQVDWYWNEGKYLRYFFASVLRLLGSYRWWRALLRGINLLQPTPRHIKEIYERWKPDVVLVTSMIPRDENALMRLARRDGKAVVGMVKSFDHLTSKSFLRMYPDLLLVPNPTAIEEAANLYDYPKERCVVVGIPQYDAYAEKEVLVEREAFFRDLKLDPSKRLILYAPAGDWMNPNDKETLEILLKWIQEGKLSNTEVLLRLHPVYESQAAQLEGTPNLVVEKPGQQYGFYKSYEFFDDDVRHLASSLKYAAVVINTASTLMVEGAIFDTPVIGLGFDGYQKKDYWHSVVRYYDREHCVPVVHSGGLRLVRSEKELLAGITEYFAHPEKDRDGRKRAVEAVCYKVDGKASERIVEALHRVLEK